MRRPRGTTAVAAARWSTTTHCKSVASAPQKCVVCLQSLFHTRRRTKRRPRHFLLLHRRFWHLYCLLIVCMCVCVRKTKKKLQRVLSSIEFDINISFFFPIKIRNNYVAKHAWPWRRTGSKCVCVHTSTNRNWYFEFETIIRLIGKTYRNNNKRKIPIERAGTGCKRTNANKKKKFEFSIQNTTLLMGRGGDENAAPAWCVHVCVYVRARVRHIAELSADRRPCLDDAIYRFRVGPGFTFRYRVKDNARACSRRHNGWHNTHYKIIPRAQKRRAYFVLNFQSAHLIEKNKKTYV